MIIKYEFVTEAVEIEVTEEWAEALAECDRNEYNNDHAESRRHTTLDVDAEYGEWILSEKDNPWQQIEAKDEFQRKICALEKLSAEQKELLYAVFCNKMTRKKYAEIKGVSPAAISQQIKTIRKILKNFVKCKK